MVFVKEWFDNHPSSLLILSSDHGHDEISVSIFLLFFSFLPSLFFCLAFPPPTSSAAIDPETGSLYKYDHGDSIQNNTGWFFFYHSSFFPAHRIMNTTDVAATWTNYLENVDIPANSVGRPHNAMRLMRNEAKVIQRGLAQMWWLCKKGTGKCKGDVYKEGLQWTPELVKEEEEDEGEDCGHKGVLGEGEEQRNKEGAHHHHNPASLLSSLLKEHQRTQHLLSTIPSLVSTNVSQLFPLNLSVTRLQRIASGRESEVRRKEQQPIPTHYYVEYDEDENGNPLRRSKSPWEEEEDEVAAHTEKEEADKYWALWHKFEADSRMLYKALFNSSLIVSAQYYPSYSSFFKFASTLPTVAGVIVECLLLYLTLHSTIKKWQEEEAKKKEEETASVLAPVLSPSSHFVRRSFPPFLLISSLLFYLLLVNSSIRVRTRASYSLTLPSLRSWDAVSFFHFVSPSLRSAILASCTAFCLAAALLAEWVMRRKRERRKGKRKVEEQMEPQATQRDRLIISSPFSQSLPLMFFSSSHFHLIFLLSFCSSLLLPFHFCAMQFGKKRRDTGFYRSFIANSDSFFHPVLVFLFLFIVLDSLLFFLRRSLSRSRERKEGRVDRSGWRKNPEEEDEVKIKADEEKEKNKEFTKDVIFRLWLIIALWAFGLRSFFSPHFW